MILSIDDYLSLQPPPSFPVVATSGGFDPLHVGHVRSLRDASALGSSLVVIVNGDSYLLRKKGYVFMPLSDRAELIDSLRWVDFVIPFESDRDTVSSVILAVKPQVFAKGIALADPAALPEWSACSQVRCEVVLDVGGPKIRSSSQFVDRTRRAQQNAE